MILRRVIAHFRKQEWTAIAIDFVIVVVGVFVGLQVNNWNEAAKDKRAETAYLSQLQKDLRLIDVEARAQVEFERYQARLAGKTYDFIAQGPSPERVRRINTGLSQLTMRRTLRIESPTFVDLQNSGKMDVIADEALRAEVVSYFFNMRRMEAAIDRNNMYYVDAGFVARMFELGVPSRPWNEKLMAMPRFKTGLDEDGFVAEVYAGPLYKAPGAALEAPPGAAIWADLDAQLSWRALVAGTNESFAQRTLQATAALDAKLAARLDWSAR